MLQDVERVDLVVTRDHLRGVEREPSREHRQPIEHRAFGFGQQLVGPVDRRLERLVARDRRAAPAGEHPEPLVEPLEDLGRRDGPRPGRRQLDGERDAVETPAELDHGRRRCRVECELRPRRARPVHEQLDRVAVGVGRERRDRHDSLRGDPEPLAARSDHPHVGCTGRDRVGDRRDARNQMLTVVDHQQQSPATQARAQARDIVLARRQRVAQRLQQQRGDAFGGVHRREVHQPRPVGELGLDDGRDLQPEPRLSHAARSSERDHRGVGDEPGDLLDRRSATNERVGLHRQVARQFADRLQRGELALQLGVRDLEHPLRLTQIAQPVVTQIYEFDRPAPQQLARRRRHDDLPAVRHAHQAGARFTALP